METQTGRSGPHRGRAHARPAVLLALTATMAYGGGLWLHLLHEAEGATEPGAPSGLVHWLRDSTLLLPIVLLATWVGLRLARRLVTPVAGGGSTVLAIAAPTAVVATATSLAEALASPLHALAFGAASDHHGASMPIPLHMAHDGLLALAANVAIAGLVFLLVRGNAWTDRPAWRPSLRQSRPLQRAFGLASSAMLSPPRWRSHR
jgi:hypothetical protein